MHIGKQTKKVVVIIIIIIIQFFIIFAEPTATRPITGTAQCR
jgi:hypothetical protein